MCILKGILCCFSHTSGAGAIGPGGAALSLLRLVGPWLSKVVSLVGGEVGLQSKSPLASLMEIGDGVVVPVECTWAGQEQTLVLGLGQPP